ncbi:MAG: hypothetical protein E7231_06880 [Cellulosilyticum sp.]|nr:hypothetical protein [Cellulosilyticum sp.]
MLNIFNAMNRVPNTNPPDFIPNKNEGEILQGPGSVMVGPGNNPPQGPGPVSIGPGNMPFQGGPGPIIINPGNKPPQQGPGPVINPGNMMPPGGFNPPRPPHQKLRPCIGRFTYLWLNNGSEFWFYVESVTTRFIYGWRLRRGRWEQGRINVNRIEAFYCNRRD